jgi:hypothetical protein
LKGPAMSQSATQVVVSFVVRNRNLSHEQFSEHYESHHGPLAAGLSGFRMYVSRYIQNHVLEKLSGTVVDIDGITILSQLPREDYSKGFFQHPDFAAHVQADSRFLFDIPKNRAFPGLQHTQATRLRMPKLLLLATTQSTDSVLTLLSADAAQVTDFGATAEAPQPFGHDRMIEAWFGSPDALRVGLREVTLAIKEPIEAWSVREVLIYDGTTI